MKTILITGSAGGLGKALAASLSKQNKVIISGHDSAALEEAARELACDKVLCDVTNWESVESAVNYVISTYGRLDVLINNAGVYVNGTLEDAEPEKIWSVYGVNSVGPILMSKAVVPQMKNQGDGYIININSYGGINARPERSVYYSSKWALTGFTKCLQEDLKEFNVKVTDIYPKTLENSMAVNGETRKNDRSISYQNVIDAVEFVITRDPSVHVPSIGLQHVNHD